MAELEQATGRTMADLASAAGERFGDKVAVRVKRDGDWSEVTYGEVGTIVDEIASGLIALGLQPGERACVLANTRPEWTFASFGISSAGGVVVPVYPTNSPKECQWVAGDSAAKVLFAEDADQVAKIAKVRDDLPELELVVVIDGEAEGAVTLDELRAKGREGDNADEIA